MSAERKKLKAPGTVADLVSRVAAAGDEIRVPDPSVVERRRWRQTLFLASTEGGVPDGKRLRFTGRDRGDLVIRLVDDTPENQPRPPVVDLPPIPVPDTLRGVHPLMAATRDRAKKGSDGWIDTRHITGILNMRIAPDSLRRTLRLSQALISEAERLGGSAQECREGVGISLRDPTIVIGLVFTEDTDKRPHQLTPAETRAQEEHERRERLGQYSWLKKPPKYDHSPSGRLELRDSIGPYGTTLLANDRKRWTFESRLPFAMHKIDSLTAEVEAARAESDAEAREHERAWREAVERARERWAEECRVAALEELLVRRRRRLEIQALAAEIAAEHRPEPGSPGGSWLEWIESQAHQLDLPSGPLSEPVIPDPTNEDLQRLLGPRWSISGPEHTMSIGLRLRLGQS